MALNNDQASLQQSYDRIAEEYARRIFNELEHKPLDRALLDYFVETVRDRGTVADIGCGPGHVGRYLFKRDVPVVGIDLSPEMVRLARELNPDMTFRQGDMRALEIDDASLAGIVAFYSIIHLSAGELPRVFGEFSRILAPGGLLLVAFHMGTKHIHLDDWWGYEVDVDTYFHERDAVEGLLEGASFVITASVERRPDEDIEYPSRRVYIIARKVDEGGEGDA